MSTKPPGPSVGLRRVAKSVVDDTPEPTRPSLPASLRPLAEEPPPPHRDVRGPVDVVAREEPDGSVGIVKAHIISDAVEESQGIPGLLEEREGALEEKLGLLQPPYDFGKLLTLYESSSALRPNVDVYATNVDSFGHRFEPAINLNAPDAPDRVRTAMVLEQLTQLEAQKPATNGHASPVDLDAALAAYEEVVEPGAGEVAARLEKLRKLALVELHRLRAFFAFANPDGSFTALRRESREEQEAVGNAFWEVLRSKDGRIARLVRIPALTVRLSAQDLESTRVDEFVRVSDLSWKAVPQRRFFRRYAQIDATKLTGHGTTASVVAWFKEFGDPRVVSRQTGVAYEDEKAMLREEEAGATAATEILHFGVFSPRSPYGIPRWIGNLPGVLGSRELEEVNESYFDNKAVPPLVILVNGGRFARATYTRIKDFFATQAKGVKNYHKALVLEAEPAASSTAPGGPRIAPTVSFEPLRDAQQTDGLFQEYDKRNIEKLGMSFRIPGILRGGDVAGVTRTAMLAALRQAEQQVFGPERDEFDDTINRRLMPALGAIFWSFKSNAPAIRDPEAVTAAIVDLTKQGVLTPAEARELAAGVFNRDLPPILEAWAMRPLAVTLAWLKAQSGPAEAARVSEGEPTDPQELLDTLNLPSEEAAILAQPRKPRRSKPEQEPEEPLEDEPTVEDA